MNTLNQVSEFIKSNMDFARFARLTKALGDQANDAQFRFIKALIFENSIEEYSKGEILYVGQEGCDLIIPKLGNARVEMKYVENALYTPARKELREHTGEIKLMNSMGTNSHKILPKGYADFLIFMGNQGAILFDKHTIEAHIKSGGDGISANLPTNKGILLATPKEMNTGNQQEIDFIQGLNNYIKTYIRSVA
jgi:hypothetical protein